MHHTETLKYYVLVGRGVHSVLVGGGGGAQHIWLTHQGRMCCSPMTIVVDGVRGLGLTEHPTLLYKAWSPDHKVTRFIRTCTHNLKKGGLG